MPTEPETSLRAPSDAASHPPAPAEWDNSPRPKTRWRTPLACAVVTVVGFGALAASAAPGARLADPACINVEVEPGDTMWAIAARSGKSLDVIANLNKHIPNPSLIRPSDTISVDCPGFTSIAADPSLPAPVVIIDAKAIDRDGNELQRSSSGETETCYKDPDETKAPEKRQPYLCYTWNAIVKALWDKGARGDDLVTLAAVTPPESGRAVDPCTTPTSCDRTMMDKTWSESGGTFQVRSLRADLGTGRTRDLNRVRTLEGGAQSAVELCHQSKQRGKPCGQPWTAFLLNNHVGWIPTVQQVVASAGLS